MNLFADRHRAPHRLDRNGLLGFLVSLTLVVAAHGVPSQVMAEVTSLWKVSKDNRHIFIGASLHALRQSDYPLPSAFERAYTQAATLVVETDRGMNLTRQGRNLLLQRARFRDGTTLKDHLRPQTWQNLLQFLERHQVPVNQIDRYKPGMLTVMLTMLQRASRKPLTDGVDAYFLQRAFADNKPIASLETLVDQIQFFADLGDEDPDGVVQHAIEEAEQEDLALDRWVAAWRIADLVWIERHPIAAMRAYPAIYKAILLDRNRAWLPALEAMLETEAVELVLVGSLHVAGQDNLLQHLTALGYTVEQTGF